MADVENNAPNIININNNNRNAIQNNMNNIRDRLFHAIYFKVAYIYSQIVPKTLRTILEYIVLMKALLFFFTLIYIHVKFIKYPATCLQQVEESWPRDGVLRVEVIHNLERREKALAEANELQKKLDHAQQQYYSLGTSGPFTKAFQRLYNSYENKLAKEGLDFNVYNVTYRRMYIKDYIGHIYASNLQFNNKKEEEPTPYTETSDGDIYVVEYSLQYGFLHLSRGARRRLNIPVRTVKLDPLTNKCFGDRLSRFLLRELIGYDDILMASVRSIAEKEKNRGYLRNVITGEHYRFVSMSWAAWISYPAAFFVMLLFTFSISMLLRFSHNQIFVFIVDLLHMMEYNIATRFPIAPLLTIILALVGMEAIMSEFFNDTTTAFYIILIVWAADQFDAICCHTSTTKRHWLRFFFLYHFAFYAYHYRFSGQNRGLALVSSWMFIQHSMLHFFHRYELPVIIEQTQLYLLRNRIAGAGGAGRGPRLRPRLLQVNALWQRLNRTDMAGENGVGPGLRPNAANANLNAAGEDADVGVVEENNQRVSENFRAVLSQILQRRLNHPHMMGAHGNSMMQILRQALHTAGWIRPLVRPLIQVRVEVANLRRINLGTIEINPTERANDNTGAATPETATVSNPTNENNETTDASSSHNVNENMPSGENFSLPSTSSDQSDVDTSSNNGAREIPAPKVEGVYEACSAASGTAAQSEEALLNEMDKIDDENTGQLNRSHNETAGATILEEDTSQTENTIAMSTNSIGTQS